MEKVNITNRTTEQGRDVMERKSGLLDKAINILNWDRGTDLYMKRYMKLFNHNHSNILEHNYGKRMPVKLQKPDWPPMGNMPHPL